MDYQPGEDSKESKTDLLSSKKLANRHNDLASGETSILKNWRNRLQLFKETSGNTKTREPPSRSSSISFRPEMRRQLLPTRDSTKRSAYQCAKRYSQVLTSYSESMQDFKQFLKTHGDCSKSQKMQEQGLSALLAEAIGVLSGSQTVFSKSLMADLRSGAQGGPKLKNLYIQIQLALGLAGSARPADHSMEKTMKILGSDSRSRSTSRKKAKKVEFSLSNVDVNFLDQFLQPR